AAVGTTRQGDMAAGTQQPGRLDGVCNGLQKASSLLDQIACVRQVAGDATLEVREIAQEADLPPIAGLTMKEQRSLVQMPRLLQPALFEVQLGQVAGDDRFELAGPRLMGGAQSLLVQIARLLGIASHPV